MAGDAEDRERGGLHGLVRESMAHVRIPSADRPDTGHDRGSAFFVAPGLALTCAHVLGSESVQGEPGTVQLIRGDGHLTGEVVYMSPAPGSGSGNWPEPDLAVIRVPDPPEHPCVRLSERLLEPGDSLWAYGIADSGEGAVPYSGLMTYQGMLGGLWRIGDDELPEGSSGGPIVDPAGFGVCAVVKARRSEGRDGGLAVPLTALRDSDDRRARALFQEIWTAHDAYHLRGAATRAPRAAPTPPPPRAASPRPAATPPAARSRMLARLGSDRPSKVDLLGNEGDVEMLAMLATALTTEPPLAMALLGEWGVGKSSTMEQMRAQVTALTERVRRRPELRSVFAEHVRQIRFNAWHYSEDHLWTGLVEHLFAELAHEEATAPAGETLELRRGRLRREHDLAVAEAERLRTVKEARDGTDSYAASGAAVGRFRAWRRRRAVPAATNAHGRWVRLGALVGAGALVAVAAALWLVAGSWVAGLIPLALGFGAAALPVWEQVAGARLAAREARAAAGARLDENLVRANARVATTADELAQVDAAVRLSAFLGQRAGEGAEYRPYRSLISQVRRDLEQLQSDLDEARGQWRARLATAPDTPPPLQRIILYIDDLDRCPPSRVVAVLAAVHLMLALELFVVVVAVDPQWLLNALHVHHGELFAVTAGETTGPLDYLDKIFQIPFVVARPIGQATSRYLRSLLGPPAPATDSARDDARAPGARATPRAPAVAPDDAPRLDVTLPELRDPRPETVQLRSEEIDFMALLGALLPTPRAAKKLVNLYRLVRIGVHESALPHFVEGQYRAVQILLAILVGEPQMCRSAFAALHAADGEEDIRTVLRALAREEGTATPIGAACLRVASKLEEIATATPLPPAAAMYQQWLPLVARFSFHTRAWV
ncbi:S1 family peptidase [Streptomyces sp. SBT349]|uniref:S1 family peptidase n=1 Tax=Streptomyces sp. SBT349 TaxID=1580539 RepID=UPI00066D9E69|nr:serine protease [Streptomyces sp. SBT349]